MIYKTEIDMVPTPKARPRFTRAGFAYTDKKTQEAEELVAMNYMADNGKTLLEGPVGLWLTFEYKVPKSYSKKDKEAAKEGKLAKLTRPDIDNLIKLVLDGLNGIAYVDDNQVVELRSRKIYSKDGKDKVKIEVVEYD